MNRRIDFRAVSLGNQIKALAAAQKRNRNAKGRLLQGHPQGGLLRCPRDARQQGEAEFDEYKKRSESTRIVKRNHCDATNRQRIQNALEYVTFTIPDTTGVVKEKRFEIDF